MRIPGKELEWQIKLDNSAYVIFDVYKGYTIKENAPQDIKDTYKKFSEYWKNRLNYA